MGAVECEHVLLWIAIIHRLMWLLCPSQALDFLLLIFATIVVAWADHEAPLLLGLSASWLPWHRDGPCGPASNILGKSEIPRVTLQEALTLFPNSMLLLLQKEPWKEQTQKVRSAATCSGQMAFVFHSSAIELRWELSETWITLQALILRPEYLLDAESRRLRPAQAPCLW